MHEEKIKINVTKKLIVKPESLFVATIKPLGNGAYAPIKKSLIGKEVYVIIKDEVREEKWYKQILQNMCWAWMWTMQKEVYCAN